VYRYVANLGLLIGQAILLYSDIRIGVTIKTISSLVILYSMIKLKLWDMVIVLTAFLLLDISKLISILFEL
jgi:hypothetical protein